MPIKKTFLGLHALAAGIRRSIARASSIVVAGPWLESLAAAAGLVDAVDAFCENIAFSVAETEKPLARGRAAGMPAHVHAGQLSDMGAAELAAELGALSADHLEYLSAAGAASLARRGYGGGAAAHRLFHAAADAASAGGMLREAGVPLAVATDCNPGSSPCTSILLALNMACTLFGLTPEEALGGATRGRPRARLGLLDDIGTLEVGKRADLALWRIEQPAELCYNFGSNPGVGVVLGGKSV